MVKLTDDNKVFKEGDKRLTERAYEIITIGHTRIA